MKRWFFHNAAAPLLAGLLLAGMLGTNALHRTPADAREYHQQARAAVESVPLVVGDWIGHDVEVPTGAVDALMPNALLSRAYTNARTGEQVTVLLVHCLDARDLQGHYPAVCYPNSGWQLDQKNAVPTRIDNQPVEKAVYRFRRGQLAGTQAMTVHNLMILPDGTFGTDMEPVDRIAGDHRYRHFGAAELQMVMPASLNADTQEAVWNRFLTVLEPSIQAIGRGGEQGGLVSASTADPSATPDQRDL